MPVRVGRMGTAFEEDTTTAAFIRAMSGAWDSVEFFDQDGAADEPLAKVSSTEPDPVDRSATNRSLDELGSLIRRYGQPRLEARFHRSGDALVFSVDGNEAETGIHVDLDFEDGSAVTVRDSDSQAEAIRGRASIKEQSDVLEAEGSVGSGESPSRWSEPVTVAEYGSIESLIGHLQAVLESSGADEYTNLRVQGAIDVLRDTHRAIEVGQTTRGEILPVVKWVARFAVLELPTGIVAWTEALKVLNGLDPAIVEWLKSSLTA